jgi:arylsulfatase A-like enzyme
VRLSSSIGCAAALAITVFACAPPAAERPNIVLIVVDTLRADAVGWYRDDQSVTPFLDELAKREGVVFWNAYSNAPATSPSVASLFTSRYVAQHGLSVNGSGAIPEEELTLAEVFRDAGYTTGAFTANFIMNAERGFAQGFGAYEMLMGRRPKRKLGGNHVNRAALAWLASLQEGLEPVFLYVQYLEPHIPHQATQAATSEAARRLVDVTSYPGRLTYAAEVLSVDTRIRELWQALDERGLLENAIVVVTADHGEQFFDHGALYHANGLYNEEVHVPLAVFRGKPQGRRDVRDVVSLVDLGPTLLELAGLDPPESFEGRSFRNLVLGAADSPAERVAYLEQDKLKVSTPYGNHRRALVSGSHKIIEHRNRNTEFYDLTADPREREPMGLASDRRESLIAGLAAARERATRRPSAHRPMEPDEDAKEALRALGYLD